MDEFCDFESCSNWERDDDYNVWEENQLLLDERAERDDEDDEELLDGEELDEFEREDLEDQHLEAMYEERTFAPEWDW